MRERKSERYYIITMEFKEKINQINAKLYTTFHFHFISSETLSSSRHKANLSEDCMHTIQAFSFRFATLGLHILVISGTSSSSSFGNSNLLFIIRCFVQIFRDKEPRSFLGSNSFSTVLSV